MENQKTSIHTIADLAPFMYTNVRDRRDFYKQRSFTITCLNTIDDSETACSRDEGPDGLEFNPIDYEEVSKYEKVGVIYELPLSPSIITLTTCKVSGEKVVKKSLIKDKLMTDDQIRAAQIECVIHSHMTHENIIKLHKYSENEFEISLVMEYANQATHLQEMILENHTPIEDDQELQVFAYDILSGLSYIHKQGAIHCDIKLENMLAHKEEDDNCPIIKICDFGCAHNISPKFNNKALKKNTVGTWGYIAPEVKNNEYIGPEIDMWAYGLILYEMTVAYKPTQVKNYKYEDGDLPFRKYDWRGKPEELKNLIQGCMDSDPEKRFTAEDALQHPYFTTQV